MPEAKKMSKKMKETLLRECGIDVTNLRILPHEDSDAQCICLLFSKKRLSKEQYNTLKEVIEDKLGEEVRLVEMP